MTESHSRIKCNFCGKDNSEVKTLISCLTAFICDECVTNCVDILLTNGIPILPSGNMEDGQSILDEIKFASLSDMLTEGGLQKPEGPYSGREMIHLLYNALDQKIKARNLKIQQDREVEQLHAEIAEFDRDAEIKRAALQKQLENLLNPQTLSDNISC